MDPDFWIELESTYGERIAQRKALYAKHGRSVIDIAPGSEPACVELLHMVIQFLCARYPTLFNFDPQTGILKNRILCSKSDTKKENPLEILLDNVPEDFLITLPDEKTGLYYLRAGLSCSAVGWNMSQKINKPLHEIHEPVPDYKEKMQFSMDRWVWGSLERQPAI